MAPVRPADACRSYTGKARIRNVTFCGLCPDESGAGARRDEAGTQIRHESRLADAPVAEDESEASVVGATSGPEIKEAREFLFASDEFCSERSWRGGCAQRSADVLGDPEHSERCRLGTALFFSKPAFEVISFSAGADHVTGGNERFEQ